MLTKNKYEFDQAFKPDSTQAQVFEQVRGFVTSFLDGFNICIFAYGQTGSGKVSTIFFKAPCICFYFIF